MFTAHIAVLYYQETLIIIGFAAELDIPPLEVPMKYARLLVSAALGLFVLLTPVFAQSAGFRVEVPFEFAVGNHTFATGEYHVTVTKPGMLQVRRLDGCGLKGWGVQRDQLSFRIGDFDEQIRGGMQPLQICTARPDPGIVLL
jgi:hypothetical protein